MHVCKNVHEKKNNIKKGKKMPQHKLARTYVAKKKVNGKEF